MFEAIYWIIHQIFEIKKGAEFRFDSQIFFLLFAVFSEIVSDYFSGVDKYRDNGLR